MNQGKSTDDLKYRTYSVIYSYSLFALFIAFHTSAFEQSWILYLLKKASGGRRSTVSESTEFHVCTFFCKYKAAKKRK